MNHNGLFGCQLLRPPQFNQKLDLGGLFQFQLFSPAGNLITSIKFKNGITNVGVAHAYDCVFHEGSQITAWYIGLVDNSGYSALAAADTMASHAGWNEFTTYSNETRVAWDEGATSNRTIASATAAEFSISGGGTVKGAFLVSNSTKNGTTGVLWSHGVFSNPPVVANGETLKVTYSLTG